MNPYESDKLLSEYLLFHYGRPDQILTGGHEFLNRGGLDFPVRCVSECVDPASLPSQSRALDLGCAVGRSSFELARHCPSVIGIDQSGRFIEAAQRLREHGRLTFVRVDEGTRTTPVEAVVPPEIDRRRVQFEQGDAMQLRADLGRFHIVLAANLLCRLPAPARLLDRLPDLVESGGQLVLTTPCTWLEEYTPRTAWIGGTPAGGSTFEELQRHLAPAFELVRRLDLPFLIREHQRKYQLGIALGSIWCRR